MSYRKKHMSRNIGSQCTHVIIVIIVHRNLFQIFCLFACFLVVCIVVVVLCILFGWVWGFFSSFAMCTGKEWLRNMLVYISF